MFGIDEPGIAKWKEAGLPTAPADEIARDRDAESGAARRLFEIKRNPTRSVRELRNRCCFFGRRGYRGGGAGNNETNMKMSWRYLSLEKSSRENNYYYGGFDITLSP